MVSSILFLVQDIITNSSKMVVWQLFRSIKNHTSQLSVQPLTYLSVFEISLQFSVKKITSPMSN